jgi:hypothetical protein
MKWDLNNVSMMATAVSGYLFVILTAGAWFRWWFKHHIKEVMAELKPNHGSSIKDKVDINTERLNRVEQRVDDIYKILCERGA